MSDDFGRRLEAALTDRLCYASRNAYEITLAVRDAVRAANAQVSAPAPGSVSSASQGLSDGTTGAGVDLADAMALLREPNGTVGLYPQDRRALLSHIESLERDAARYRWLRGTDQESADRAVLRGGIGMDEFIDAARKEGKP